MKETFGIYIHIPFCSSKCYYCDFCSYSTKNTLIEQYIDALKNEIISYKGKNMYVDTIYIGGGTPSSIESKYIYQILQIIKSKFHVFKNAEITIEINPNSHLIKEKLDDYFSFGVNRLSIGLQTSNQNIAKYIGREISNMTFMDTYMHAIKIGFKNISVDIITGLPNDTINSFVDTMNFALSLPKLKHLSMYALEVHDNTRIKKILDDKLAVLPNDIIERRMTHKAQEMLKAKGFIQYELSNYAKLGYQSKHNIKYWEQSSYLGFGLNSSSMPKIGYRYKNTKELEEYIIKKGITTYLEEKTIDKKDIYKEYMLLKLRMLEGVNIQEFERKFKISPLVMFDDIITFCTKNKLLKVNKKNIALTKRALDVANQVFILFI